MICRARAICSRFDDSPPIERSEIGAPHPAHYSLVVDGTGHQRYSERTYLLIADMIPPCSEQGYLPAGIHRATLEEIDARFGQASELRRVQMESLRWLVDLGRRAGALRIVVNGSFVTDVLEPNDVDCVLLVGSDFPRDSAAEAELIAGLPFVNLEMVGAEGFQQLTERTFATDRDMIAKGMLEIAP
jgi:hypothetical protein